VQVKAWTFAHRIQGPINRLKSLCLSFFSISFSLFTSSQPLHSLLLRSEKEIRWGSSVVVGRPSTAPPPCRNPRVLILLFFCFFSFPPLFSSFFNDFFIKKKKKITNLDLWKKRKDFTFLSFLDQVDVWLCLWCGFCGSILWVSLALCSVMWVFWFYDVCVLILIWLTGDVIGSIWFGFVVLWWLLCYGCVVFGSDYWWFGWLLVFVDSCFWIVMLCRTIIGFGLKLDSGNFWGCWVQTVFLFKQFSRFFSRFFWCPFFWCFSILFKANFDF